MKQTLLAASAIAAILSTAAPAFADAETDALRAQIKLLEARLDQMEKREKTRVAQPAAPAAPARAYALPAAGSSLEKRVALVERKQEINEEIAKSQAEKNATVEMGKKGLSITSPDKQFGLKLNGYAQFDYRHFLSGGQRGDNEFLARRIRPTLTIQAWKDFSFRIMPDFAGASTRIFDAHADYRFTDSLQFRIGKFKPPVGLERLQSAADTMFAERGNPTNLAPSRDYGFMIYGEPIPEIEYQVGVFNGTTDLGSTDADDDNHKDIAARIFATPFRNSSITFQNLGFGVGGSVGKRDSTAATTQLVPYKTPGQLNFFTYGTGVYAQGDAWRLYPQAYYYLGSFGLLGEYAISSQDLRLGATKGNVKHNAWQVAASYLVTGEEANFKGSPKPNRNFDPKNGGWGAWEIVGRVGETDIDNAAFPVFASRATSASNVRSYGAGINWYMNENVRLVGNYEFSQFDGGATGGNDRADEHVAISRVQFRF